MTAPRVLVVAENASARFGGEAILPLKYFRLLRARGRDVRLITHARNRDELSAVCPDDADRIRYVEDSRLQVLVWRLGARLPRVLRDHLFGAILAWLGTRQQRRLIRDLVASGKAEVIHQPIPVSPVAPSFVHGFGVPVVIGPMNGGMRYPPGYEALESRAARMVEALGRRLGRAVNRVIPGKRRAAVLLVANARTAAALPCAHPQVIELVENGVDTAIWTPPAPTARSVSGFRLVFMGRLVDWKALDITLQALARARAQCPDAGIGLEILGDGPERDALQAQAKALGVAEHVRFAGFLPQVECVERLRQGDALILSSLRECGGAVVLEAMSQGLPVIASDWGGPADYLDADTGILVHPAPRADFADRLAQAIVALARDPERARRMGAAGAAKVRRDFDWQHKIDRIESIYAKALTGRLPSS